MLRKGNSVLLLLVTLSMILVLSTVHAQEGVEIPEGTPITVGVPVEGQISADTPIVAYTFDGLEGDAIRAFIDDENYVATHLIFADADGEILFYTGVDPTYQHTTFAPLFILPADGTYSVAVTNSEYFYMQEVGEETTFSLTLEATVYETVSYGDVREGKFTLEDSLDVFVFEGGVADLPYAVLESESSQLVIDSLNDPEFTDIEGNTPYASHDVYVTPFYLMDEGLYSIVVYSTSIYSEEEQVPYKLTFANYEPKSITPGETVGVELDVASLVNYLTFEGTTGQEASVSVEAGTDLQFNIVIFDPDGQVVGYAQYGEFIEDARLPNDGVYVIGIIPSDFMIDPADFGTINVTLEVE
jgi:hypothetical protein